MRVSSRDSGYSPGDNLDFSSENYKSMQPKWNITGMPCKIDKKSIKLDVTDALSKEFAASDKLDIMVGKNPVQLVPVDIKIYAVNTDDFIASLVKCFDGIEGLTDLESICKEHTPEVSPSYINHILNYY